ncbi:MAG TPA: PHP domain-containing protein [Vicinamibacterales bacterium]|nr:PHP domain-containing protein [Vicinamibacterales bacterium]
MRTLRADLHVHSWHSRQSGNMRFLQSRDCYSNPRDVYRTAKARGMDVVTITDHDSIDGCLEFLNHHPDAADFFISEEVSCRLPEGDVEVHLGVYGTNERLHRELQPLRGNVFDVTARLREAGVLFALNHLLHFYRGQLPFERYLRLLDEVPALEVRNGTMLPAHNALVEQLALRGAGGRMLGMLAGSDAHTLRRIGRTWTEAPGESVADFLASLQHCRARAGGEHGRTTAVAGDAYGVVGRYAASLIGRGPCEQPMLRRAACLAFSIVSLPAQFVPLALVASGKRREARAVRVAASTLERA